MRFDELIHAWQVNHAINLELLGLCEDEDFELKPGKGKTIRSNFVHIVSVRRQWIEAMMKKAIDRVPKLDWKVANREQIIAGLESSKEGMQEVFVKLNDTSSALGLFTYCIAHEANHRAQIEIALRIHDREPSDEAIYSLWDWSKRMGKL